MSTSLERIDLEAGADTAAQEVSSLDVLVTLAERWKLLVIGPLLAGCVALAATYAITPVYTARTSLLPPQPQGSAASALASIGALAGAAANAAGIRTPADQYVALMQSTSVGDALIDRFKLMDVYEVKYRAEARRILADNARISLNKRAGIITIEVDDVIPKRAAELAGAYVVELRRLTGSLAITEAQQRRAFFESQMQQAKERLTSAQKELQGSGFGAGALRAEPKVAAEVYGRLKAEVRAAEVTLQALRGNLSDAAPEVRQQLATISARRAQLASIERASEGSEGPDYVSKFREFKYQETLFELLSRQYESAKVDEAREGALVQVIDAADVPERKSYPKRAITALATATVVALFLIAWALIARKLNQLRARPSGAQQLSRLRQALRWRASRRA